MKCPHCLENFHEIFHTDTLWAGTSAGKEHSDPDGQWSYKATTCPACERFAIYLLLGTATGRRTIQVWPKGIARSPLPREVTEPFATDYREACNVLADSAKASAALSRRCLQSLLRDKAGTKSRDLAPAIDEVLASKTLPSDLANAIDAIRNVGVFGAHPLKSTNTGAVLDVEPGEAEWNLDVLEDLFDFYFVRPARLAAKRAALDKKLAEAGKRPMKKSL